MTSTRCRPASPLRSATSPAERSSPARPAPRARRSPAETAHSRTDHCQPKLEPGVISALPLEKHGLHLAKDTVGVGARPGPPARGAQHPAERVTECRQEQEGGADAIEHRWLLEEVLS